MSLLIGFLDDLLTFDKLKIHKS